MFQNHYTPLIHRQSYVRNRYNTFNEQSNYISNEGDTKINNELYTHKDSNIIGMKLDNEGNDDIENEEIINEEPSDEDSSKLFSKKESSENSAKDSDKELTSEESNGDYSSEKSSEADEELDEESDDEYFSREYFSEESNEESDEEPDRDEKIIDKPLKNEHMPHISGEFAPYFSNITEVLMFYWIQKHNICTV